MLFGYIGFTSNRIPVGEERETCFCGNDLWRLTQWREEMALAASSISSFPGMPIWEGTQMNEIEVLLFAKEDSRTWIWETRG